MTDPTYFNCVSGCGACCNGRFVPLTLAETEMWLARGDDVVVLLEAFPSMTSSDGFPDHLHHLARSASVQCGSVDMQVIAIFAANNLQGCPNQLDDTLCGIYEDRPLVCRIYPMEINPSIKLIPENKECPPSAWSKPGSHGLIASDGQPSQAVIQLIDASREADRDDANAKVEICRHLGFSTAAWKGNGLSAFFPTVEQLANAITQQRSTPPPPVQWRIHAHGEPLLQQLAQRGLQLASESPDHLFIPLAG